MIHDDYKIIRQNAQGVQLIRGKFGLWIGKLNADGPNLVLNVGADKYIRGLWNKRHCFRYRRTDRGGWEYTWGDIDNSLKV